MYIEIEKELYKNSDQTPNKNYRRCHAWLTPYIKDYAQSSAITTIAIDHEWVYIILHNNEDNN